MHTFVSSSLGDYKHPEAAHFQSVCCQEAMKCKWKPIELSNLFTQEDNSWRKMENFNNQPVVLDEGQTGI